MRIVKSLVLLAVLLVPGGALAAEKVMTVTGMWHFSHGNFTRIVFEVEEAAPYVVSRSNDGRSVVLSSYDGLFALKTPIPPVQDALVAGIEPWNESGKTYVVLQVADSGSAMRDFTLRNPDRIVLDIMKPGIQADPFQKDETIIIVLDPGHGGRDLGILSSQGLEKTFDLEIAAKIGRILRKQANIQIVQTRERDQTLSLDSRAALSAAANASIFVSIHAGQGAESRVYLQDVVEDADVPVLSNQAESEQTPRGEAGDKAARIWGIQQAGYAEQSRDLGRRIVRQLAEQESAEPVQAALAGLSAVNVPAVMVEVGISADRTLASEKIAKGIEQFVNDIRQH